jgi:hypothetical protein
MARQPCSVSARACLGRDADAGLCEHVQTRTNGAARAALTPTRSATRRLVPRSLRHDRPPGGSSRAHSIEIG